MNDELTDEQIEDRHDLVDNCIYKMLFDIVPTKTIIDWDIELIGDIRDMIIKYHHMNPEEQQEFYPYLKD